MQRRDKRVRRTPRARIDAPNLCATVLSNLFTSAPTYDFTWVSSSCSVGTSSRPLTANRSYELNNISVIDPGDWFGKTWLVEIGGSFTPLFFIVEANSVTDAIDELADSDKHGHHVVVADEDLAESCNYGPGGQVIDLDHVMIHGSSDVCHRATTARGETRIQRIDTDALRS